MARAALLAAVALLASWCSAQDAPATTRRLLQETQLAQQPCVFDPSGQLAPWPGLCAVNPVFTAAQTPGSPGAAADIAQVSYEIACASHFVDEPTSPLIDAVVNGTALPDDVVSNLTACNEDTANFCQVILSEDGTRMSCAAAQYAGAVQYGGLCPGAPFTAYHSCHIRRRDECSGGCVWNTQTSSYPDLLQQVLQASNNTVWQRTFCLPAPAASLASASDLEWYLGYLQNNHSALGNCSYAASVRQREGYALLCDSFNDASGVLGIMQGTINITSGTPVFNGINATLVTQCLEAGCNIFHVPAGAIPALNPYDSVRYQCGVFEDESLAMGWYNSTADTSLLRAVRTCSLARHQFSQTACESAALVPY